MVFNLTNPRSFTIGMTTPTELQDLQNKASLTSTGSNWIIKFPCLHVEKASTEVSIKLLQPFYRKSEMLPLM